MWTGDARAVFKYPKSRLIASILSFLFFDEIPVLGSEIPVLGIRELLTGSNVGDPRGTVQGQWPTHCLIVDSGDHSAGSSLFLFPWLHTILTWQRDWAWRLDALMPRSNTELPGDELLSFLHLV